MIFIIVTPLAPGADCFRHTMGDSNLIVQWGFNLGLLVLDLSGRIVVEYLLSFSNVVTLNVFKDQYFKGWNSVAKHFLYCNF